MSKREKDQKAHSQTAMADKKDVGSTTIKLYLFLKDEPTSDPKTETSHVRGQKESGEDHAKKLICNASEITSSKVKGKVSTWFAPR
jgi:hypothetical protein